MNIFIKKYPIVVNLVLRGRPWWSGCSGRWQWSRESPSCASFQPRSPWWEGCGVGAATITGSVWHKIDLNIVPLIHDVTVSVAAENCSSVGSDVEANSVKSARSVLGDSIDMVESGSSIHEGGVGIVSPGGSLPVNHGPGSKLYAQLLTTGLHGKS